jgi:hypothetical protein
VSGSDDADLNVDHEECGVGSIFKATHELFFEFATRRSFGAQAAAWRPGDRTAV